MDLFFDAAWRKSSYSGTQSNCVEVAMAWRKSSYSGSQTECVEVAVWCKSSYSGTETNCVEVALAPVVVGVRDTKDRPGGRIEVSPGSWNGLLSRLSR